MSVVYCGALNMVNNICGTIPLDNSSNIVQEGECIVIHNNNYNCLLISGLDDGVVMPTIIKEIL